MDNAQYQRIKHYREQNQLFLQMELESEIREVTRKIEKYQISEHTIPSILVQELEPLQHRVNLLIQQLKSKL